MIHATRHSPYLRASNSITLVMLKVLLALLPGIAIYVWFFGIGVLIQIALSVTTALICEAAMLRARNRPIAPALGDLSAVVTAVLIALAFPPLAPWWITVAGCAIAIIVAKHLYGGLGQNPFNPAMVAYAAMIVSFPALMSQWPQAGLGALQQIHLIFGSIAPDVRVIDAITSATPLDSLRTAQRLGDASAGPLGAWAWIAFGYLLGGLYLLQQRIITWHIPSAFLASLAILSGIAYLIAPGQFGSPLFQLSSGAAMLGAFFILTDPVSGASTPRGKLIFAIGAGLITWLIRSFGAYPDGVAFAVLLMNLCVPLIDMKTQPPVFGRKPS